MKNTGSTALFVTVITEKIPLQGKEKRKSSKLDMSVVYQDMSGKTIDVKDLVQGTEFVALVRITNPSNRTNYEQMALNQIFPSGWEINNSRLDGDYDNSTRYKDIRDDRVLSYYTLAPRESKTIRVTLNATYQGRFYLPALFSEAMYDHSIHAQIPGKWVEVRRQESKHSKPS